MSTNLATINKEARLAIPQPEYSNEQIKLLAETVAKGCDQNELAFFLQVAKLKRLDPFSGQIHVVKRWDSSLGKEKMTVQTGIDGYRAVASRTGDLAGIDDAEYDTETDEHPNWARVTVYRYGRSDEKVPYRGTARWGEYVQVYKDKQSCELKPNPMWKKMPYLMLGKVAEALALRKAFPDELSGMYTNEEMDQADSEPQGTTPGSVTGHKPPVSMPKSTDEKKPDPKPAVQQGKAETKQQNPPAQHTAGPDKLSGEISSVTPGKNGLLVLAVNGSAVLVPKEHVIDDLVVGAKILCSVVKVKVKGQDYLEARDIEMCVLPVEDGEIIEAEVTESPKGDKAAEHGAYIESLGNDLFGEEKPKAQTTMEASATGETTKPGTIGLKRAKRLYALITQNHRNTGFTEEECKKIMSALPIPIEHVRDIEMGMYETFERWATGEEDFNLFWKD